MPTQTPYHSLLKPVPLSIEDEDQWGGQLNLDIDTIDEELPRSGSLANRPAPAVPGRKYVTTNEDPPTWYLDTGTAWVEIGGATGDLTAYAALAEAETITGAWTFNAQVALAAALSLGTNGTITSTITGRTLQTHTVGTGSEGTFAKFNRGTSTPVELVVNDTNAAFLVRESAAGAEYLRVNDTGAVNTSGTLSQNGNPVWHSGNFDPNTVNADRIDGYHVQKNGTDGTGIINFKTV